MTLFRAVSWAALALALTFLGVPIAALFLRVPPGELLGQLGSETAREALWVTVQANVIAQVIVIAVGTPASYLLATTRFRGRDVVISVLELPLVLPPAVAGVALLAAFGRSGLLGGQLEALGITLPFTEAAVVLAVVFVSSPFYVRAAIAGFEAVDPQLVDAARTLGAGPTRVFGRIALPLAAGALGAGATLAFARGLGEFGATIMFAGSLPGLTQTMPLAIYDALDDDFGVALALGALLVLASIVILLLSKALPRWARSTSTSTSLSARSISG
jgi:molybdate transport system permease protein